LLPAQTSARPTERPGGYFRNPSESFEIAASLAACGARSKRVHYVRVRGGGDELSLALPLLRRPARLDRIYGSSARYSRIVTARVTFVAMSDAIIGVFDVSFSQHFIVLAIADHCESPVFMISAFYQRVIITYLLYSYYATLME